MAAFDERQATPIGMFPYAGGIINPQHPLAPNLVFLGVAFAGGFMDLVTRSRGRMIVNNLTYNAIVQIQHTGSEAGAAWQFGSGSNNIQARVQFNNLKVTPTNAMNMAIAVGCMNPLTSVIAGGAMFEAVDPASENPINNGGMKWQMFGNQPQVVIGGNGGVNSDIPGITLANVGQAENLVASNDTGTCTVYTRSQTTTTSTTSRTSTTALTQVALSCLSGIASRPVIWGMVWNTPITAAQAALLTPLRGRIPNGRISRKSSHVN